MVKCIIHCADLHIRNFQRLDEYTEQLNKFVEKCREIASNYKKNEVRILICGDIAHAKLSVSNELFVVMSFLIRQLEEIATVIVVAGNHDLIVTNQSRTDTITALFDTANFKNAKFLDAILDYSSGIVKDENVVWALYSIYDNFNKPNLDMIKKTKNTRVIGLYHGMIVGASLQNGMVSNEGINCDAFKGCDCVMAGHIHLRQELRHGNVDVVYSGSLIQQTFGETVSQHGFVVWNLEDMTHEYVDIDTDYGLYDFEISSIEEIDENKERLVNE